MRRIVFFCLLLIVSVAHADAPSDKLIGLWGSERVFGPAVSGILTLDGRSGDWQASVAGYSAAVQHDKSGISFALPGAQGSFRGTLSADGKRIEGFWIQPAGVTLQTPYATPLTLAATADKVWQGQVQPLTDRVSLYLVVSRADDGSLKAFIRNPEFNFGMRRAYEITLDGDKLALDDTQRKHDQLRGSYDPEQDVLTIDLQGIASFDFTRRDRDHALGFYPRTPATPYAYRVPVQEDDGWKTGDLQAAGLDPKPLAALVQQVLDTQTDWYTTPYIQSILVAHHGKLAMEEYFYGFDWERTHDSRSSGKTLTGTLVGMVLDHGAKFGVDTPVLSLLPEYHDLADPDPRKQKITVQDLLTMDSGFACDDNDDASPGNEDTMQGQDKQPDWYKYILDVPMMDDPGDRKAVYCTAGINLLGAVLRDTTHRQLMDLFQQYYAGPLQIHDYHMNLAPNGDAYMGGGIYLKPRDMLKLGQMYLDGGVWKGTRVLSKAWVDAATVQHSYFPASDYAPGHGYGYTWHLFEAKVGGKTYKEYMAQGNGGQLVMVVPDLDLAVVVTAGNYGNFPTWRKFFEELMPQYLIPAAGG
ncbi:MAG TPA: serine hydrolase [Gammaproteobacteria bacterium]|jgi:CubicO group peptidase (beta-lactamase class C family)